MGKPLNEFGGWLRFFQIVAAINFLIATLVLAITIFFLFSGLPDPSITYGHLYTAIAVGTPFAVLMVAICRKLPVRDTSTPRQSARLAWGALTLALISTFLEAAFTVAASPEMSYFDAYEWPTGIFWLLVFVSYLEHSKRVKAYYGVNHPEHDPNTPKYLADPIGEMVEGWKNRPGQNK